MIRAQAVHVRIATGGRLWSLAWAVLLMLLVCLNVAAIPPIYVRASDPPSGIVAMLNGLGLGVPSYAVYMAVVQSAFGLVCFASAAAIWWQLPRQTFPRFVAVLLVLATAASPPNLDALVTSFPWLDPLARLAEVCLVTSLIAFPFVFPTGRFVPGWTRLPVLILIGAVAVTSFALNGSLADPPDPIGAFMLLGLSTGLAAMVYRFFWRSTAVERQQTKWVVTSGSIVLALTVFDVLVFPQVPSVVPPELRSTPFDPISVTIMSLGYALLPVSVALAILRYRLWDVDAIINRALVYASLSGTLLAIYAVVVSVAGAALRTEGSGVPALLATLLIVLSVRPLHARIQRLVNRVLYGDRDEPYVALTRLGRQLESTLTPEAILPTIVSGIVEALRVPYAALAVKGTDGVVLHAAIGTATEPQLRLPVSFHSEPLGELSVSPRAPGERFSANDRRLLLDLAQQAGVAAHAVLLAADLERSRLKLVLAREDARRQLGSDLHDGLGHRLAGLLRVAERAAVLVETDGSAARQALVDLGEQTRSAIHDVRQLAHQLHPPELELLGLVGALREQADRHSLADRPRVSVEAAGNLGSLPAAVELAAYLIACEALTNVERHAAARTCRVRVALVPPSAEDAVGLIGATRVLQLEVIDDGRGIGDADGRGLGVASMRARATELGGSFRLEAAQPCGTQVVVRLPCPAVG